MTQTPERTYDCGSQLLHQLDGGFHGAAGLDPLVNQQHLHTCRGRQRLCCSEHQIYEEDCRILSHTFCVSTILFAKLRQTERFTCFSFQSFKVFIGTDPVNKHQFHQLKQKSIKVDGTSIGTAFQTVFLQLQLTATDGRTAN